MIQCVFLLAGQLVHVQCHRAFLVALLVVLRHVHVTFCVACVVGHPHSDRGACNSQLAQCTMTSGGKDSKTIEEKYLSVENFHFAQRATHKMWCRRR